MKPTQIAIPLFCIALGYVSGRRFSSPESADAGMHSDSLSVNSRASRSHESLDTSNVAHRQPRTKGPERSTRAKSAEPRVSIPISSVVSILSDKPVGLNGFEHYEQPMGEALTLLGATEEERSQVMELMAQTKNELLEAEQRVLRTTVVSDFEASVDLHEMDESAATIIERTRSGLQSILPAEIGHALVASINWNQFYRNDLKTGQGAVRFGISRDTDGSLMYQVNYGNGGAIMGKSELMLDDGNAIRADEVFPERWRALLTGVELLPQEAP